MHSYNIEKLKFDKKIILSIFKVEESDFRYPLYISKAQAGFPSPADDYIENKLKLDEIVVKNPAATYFIRVTPHAGIRTYFPHKLS